MKDELGKILAFLPLIGQQSGWTEAEAEKRPSHVMQILDIKLSPACIYMFSDASLIHLSWLCVLVRLPVGTILIQSSPTPRPSISLLHRTSLAPFLSIAGDSHSMIVVLTRIQVLSEYCRHVTNALLLQHLTWLSLHRWSLELGCCKHWHLGDHAYKQFKESNFFDSVSGKQHWQSLWWKRFGRHGAEVYIVAGKLALGDASFNLLTTNGRWQILEIEN